MKLTMKITLSTTNNTYTKKHKTESFKNDVSVSSPAFKGLPPKRMSFFSRVLDFFKKKPAKLRETSSQILKNFDVHPHPPLPFDGGLRLRRLGIKEEHISTFLETANGNQQHFGYLVRMKKDGFDEKHICSIFNSCKNYQGQLKVKLYTAAIELNFRNVPSKYIKNVLENFKITANTFDYDGFKDYIKLKNDTVKKASEQVEDAFCNLGEDVISKYFYENIRQIKAAKKVMGEEGFLNLTELEPKVFDKTIREVFYNARVKKSKPDKKIFIGDSVLPHS